MIAGLSLFAFDALAQPGQLDPTFGTGGRVVSTWSGRERGTAVAIQADGKIVVAGETYSTADPASGDFAVARYNVDGSLDPTFGSGGRVTTEISGQDRPTAVAIDTVGRIVVSGTSAAGVALTRYLADGTLDPAFGTGGRASLPPFAFRLFEFPCVEDVAPLARAAGLQIQSDGRIVVAVEGADAFERRGFGRFDADGQPDQTLLGFGCGSFRSVGSALFRVDLGLQLFGVVVDASGRVVVGATRNGFEQVVLLRFLANGQFDPSLGVGGIATFVPPSHFIEESGRAIVTQADGKIVVVATVQRINFGAIYREAIELLRYNVDGTLDVSFGANGRVETWYPGYGLSADAVALDSNGNILVAGCVETASASFSQCQFAPNSSNTNVLLARYSPNGVLDPTFGSLLSGIDVAERWDGARGVAVQADGRIVAVGGASPDGVALQAFAVVRVLGGTVSCTATLTPNARSVSRAQGSGTIDVAMPSGCPWTAASAVPWMVVTAGAAGSGAGTITYVYAANDSTTSRVGALTIAGQTFTLTQGPATPPTITASPPDASVAAAQNVGFSVSASGDPVPALRWQLSPDGNTWSDAPLTAPYFGATTVTLTIQSVTSALNGYRFRAVAANVAGAATSAAARLTVVANCTYSSVTGDFVLPAGGGQGHVDLTTGPGCPWTAGSASPWLSVSPASGAGSARITYAAAANTTGAQRAAQLFIAGGSSIVRQAPVTSTLTIVTTTLPAGIVGSAYAATLSTSGGSGAIAWSLAGGMLPVGVSLVSTGTISGTMAAAGTANFTVRATDASGASATRSLSIVVLPPSAPVLAPGVVNRPNLTLTWTPPTTGPTPTAYAIVASLAPGGPVIALLPVGTQTSLTVAAPDGTFFIRVLATVNGSPVMSNEIRVDIAPPALPSPPQGLIASVAGSVITFAWQAPSGSVVTTYVLEAGSGPGLSNLARLPLGNVTTFVSPPVPNGSYYVRVRAQNASGTGPASSEVRAVVGPPPPSAPALTGSGSVGGFVAMSWSVPASGTAVTGYQLHAGSAPGASNIAVIYLQPTQTALATGGVPAGSYYVRVVATSAQGLGEVSNELLVTVP